MLFLSALAAFALQDRPSSNSSGAAQVQRKGATLSPPQIAELKIKAEGGDPDAQTNLAQAYRDGDGVPANEEVAARWFRKAADQGFARAENNLGTMYRLGDGVERDKEEAVRWYAKAARHGSPEGMFNLGTCYYNGDGIGSNEFTAYAWFLLADDAGNSIAKDAVQRSATTMSNHDTSAAYLQIADMYEKGGELPKNEAQMIRWLRKAAEIDSQGKLRLAVHLLTAPEGSRNYPQALELCKAAAKDYVPALPCVSGSFTAKGLESRRIPSKQQSGMNKVV